MYKYTEKTNPALKVQQLNLKINNLVTVKWLFYSYVIFYRTVELDDIYQVNSYNYLEIKWTYNIGIIAINWNMFKSKYLLFHYFHMKPSLTEIIGYSWLLSNLVTGSRNSRNSGLIERERKRNEKEKKTEKFVTCYYYTTGPLALLYKLCYSV